MTTGTTGTTITTTEERGGTNTAVATWRGGWRCDVDAGGFALVVDEPPDAGGTGLGPMPTDLLLASFSSCYALALAWAARKRGFELPDLEVTATGTYEGQKFGSLLLTVRSSLPAERLMPLLEPARRVCYVSNTFAHGPSLEVALAEDTDA
jgi:organic hydroperoxide reductase OsmC/OhrA